MRLRVRERPGCPLTPPSPASFFVFRSSFFICKQGRNNEQRKTKNEKRKTRRAGLTLLEVVVSLAIFLFSLAALAQLLSVSRDQVLQGYLRTQATLRCQSKMAEVLGGAQSLSSSGWTGFSDDANWEWQLNASQGEVTNLWNVQVSVQRKPGTGSTVEVSMARMMFPPTMRGSTLVNPSYASGISTSAATSGAAAAPSGSSSSSGSSGGTGQ
jgi:general secretion pathway protein I